MLQQDGNDVLLGLMNVSWRQFIKVRFRSIAIVRSRLSISRYIYLPSPRSFATSSLIQQHGARLGLYRSVKFAVWQTIPQEERYVKSWRLLTPSHTPEPSNSHVQICFEATHNLFLSCQGKESRVRRDELLAIQREAQKRWAEERIFEVNAPAEGGLLCCNRASASS